MSEPLQRALAHIRDSGYQPMYNGRPSCPFCHNFVDDEETHRPDCVLQVALSQGAALDPEMDYERRDAMLRVAFPATPTTEEPTDG